MKKVFSVLLAFAVTVAMIPSVAAAGSSITGIKNGQLVQYSYVDQDPDNVYVESEFRFQLDPDSFTWDGQPPARLTTGALQEGGISLGYSVYSDNPNLIQSVNFYSYSTSTWARITFNQPAGTSFEAFEAFDMSVVLLKDGVPEEGTRTPLTGTVVGKDVYIVDSYSGGFHNVDEINLFCVSDQEECLVWFKNDVSFSFLTSKGALFSGAVDTVITPQDQTLMQQYPQIKDAFAIALSDNLKHVTFDMSGLGTRYIYDGNLNYLGTTADAIPYAAKYYVAVSKLNAPLPQTCTITYHPNGATSGVPPVDTKQYYPGTYVDVIFPGDYGYDDQGFGKQGYYFLGWNSKPDGTGNIYGERTLLTENLTVYANWGLYDPNAIVNIYNTPLFPDQLGQIYAPGTVLRFPLSEDQFRWRDTNHQKLSLDLLKANKVVLRQSVSFGSSAIDYIHFVQLGEEVFIEIILGKPAKTMNIEFRVYPLLDGKRFTEAGGKISGSVTGTGIALVTFNDGTTSMMKEVPVDTAFGANWPINPRQYGYIFDGWFDIDYIYNPETDDFVEVATQYFPDTPIPENMTLRAKWTKSNVTSGGPGGGGGGGGGGTTRTDTARPASSPSASNITESAAIAAAQKAATAAKASGKAVAAISVKNPGVVSLATWKAMVKAAGMPAKVYADSMSSDGKAVDVRFVLDPAQVTKELTLTGSATNANAVARKSALAKHFSNKMMVISLGQVGEFGLPVEIIAKIDPTLNRDTLVFYSYSKATNRYKKIETPGYWVDKNDYLHFTTQLAGDIVITDQALQGK